MNHYQILEDLKEWLDEKRNRLGDGVEPLVLVSEVQHKIDALENEHE